MNSSTLNKLKSLPADKLMSKLGAQFFKDEFGNRFVVGFGQSSVKKSQNRQSNFVTMARKKARLKAVENIKNLVAENIVGKEISESKEVIEEDNIYTEDNFSELIKSKKSSLKMNTLKIKDWDGVHPVSNSRVIGSIVILTESNNINFKSNDLKNNSRKNTTDQSEYYESNEIEGEEF